MATGEELRALARTDPLAAARAAREAGDEAEASRFFEQACAFEEAGRSALAGGDAARALELGLLATGPDAAALVREALAEVVRGSTPERLAAHADRLARRGFGGPAGELWLAAGLHRDAGDAFAAAGDALRAARAYEEAGVPAEAAKALERALALDPGRGELSLALGALLARHGRDRQAAQILQSVPAGAPERRDAARLLREVLRRLGLEEAARALDAEAGDGPPSEPTAAPAGPVQERLLGAFEVVAEVAVTPHARLLHARDAAGADVALKIFASSALLDHGRDALLRFEAEAKALSRLRHPHIVGFRGYFPEGPAIAMEWMSGGSLAERIERGEPMAPARAVEIATATLLALGEAHRLGILHRDVKPSNVLFDGVGTPRLADFGAAHIGDLSATATAARIGTIDFMSPEQRLGRPATVRSDVFGVGMLLVTMLWGAPLRGAARGHVREIHPDLGEPQEAVLAQLVADAPDARPPDAFAAARLLSAVTWSARAVPRAASRGLSSRPPPSAPEGGRLRALGALALPGGSIEVAEDTWTGRLVWLVPLGPDPAPRLRRASAWARASHPALLPVLRVDRDADVLWVEAPPPGARDAAADPALAPVVAALREAGVEDAHLDMRHAARTLDGELVVAFAP